MDITVNWQVRRSAVYSLGGNALGITDWGIQVDGGLSRIVQPHIQACLELMGLRAERIAAGTASPFLSAVGDPSSYSADAMEAFAELLALRTIEGQYCDEPGRAMFIQWHKFARIESVRQLHGCQHVKIVGRDMLGLRLLRDNMASCLKIIRPDDRRLVELYVEAEAGEDLSRALRLIGNVAQIRWDHKDVQTFELLGEPLL